MRYIPGLLTVVALAIVAFDAQAHAVIDCPLRDAPWSIDTPVLDLLNSPDAKATIERVRPELLRTLTPRMRDVRVPSFGAIVTPRGYAELRRQNVADLEPLDQALRRLPVTAADRERRCARYDRDVPTFALPHGRPRVLLFEKMTGFRDGPSVEAASSAISAMAARRGWALVRTDRGGIMNRRSLAQFDAVIWNNVSGDVLTVKQREAFRRYIERGGGYVGIHGSAGDPVYFWKWYADRLVGARFIGHPLGPQFQSARVIAVQSHVIGNVLPAEWTMSDEWYSFAAPSNDLRQVVARLDEATYSPMALGKDLRTGNHPIAWTTCVGRGRSFYTAIGHLPETYIQPAAARLLERGIEWAAQRRCKPYIK